MIKALIWLAFTYGLFKIGAFFLAGKSGFQRTDVRFLTRLRAGEPGLFIAAFLLSVPLAYATTWYADTSLTTQYEDSATCYAQIMALKDAPELKGQIDSTIDYNHIQGYKAMVFRTGADLGMPEAQVSKALTDMEKSASERYTMLQKEGRRQDMLKDIDAARRCLHP